MNETNIVDYYKSTLGDLFIETVHLDDIEARRLLRESVWRQRSLIIPQRLKVLKQHLVSNGHWDSLIDRIRSLNKKYPVIPIDDGSLISYHSCQREIVCFLQGIFINTDEQKEWANVVSGMTLEECIHVLQLR